MKKHFAMGSLALISSFLLLGCASQQKIAKIEPHKWTQLKCSGILTWTNCSQEALAICPNGFYTADEYENIYIQRREVSVACKS